MIRVDGGSVPDFSTSGFDSRELMSFPFYSLIPLQRGLLPPFSFLFFLFASRSLPETLRWAHTGYSLSSSLSRFSLFLSLSLSLSLSLVLWHLDTTVCLIWLSVSAGAEIMDSRSFLQRGRTNFRTNKVIRINDFVVANLNELLPLSLSLLEFVRYFLAL